MPKVVFIPYASENFEENYKGFKQIYQSFGCNVTLLQPGAESSLLEADLIYLGRGMTLPLIEKLNETGAAALLNQVFNQGTVIAGFSAGANALFSYAGSNEGDLGFTLVKGLGFVEGCLNTHYNYEERAEAFHKLLLKNNIDGIGLSDHTMLVIDQNVATLYASKKNAHG